MSVPLTKVDSAIAGLSIDEKPIKTDVKDKKTHKRNSSTAEGVWSLKDLGQFHHITHAHHTDQIRGKTNRNHPAY